MPLIFVCAQSIPVHFCFYVCSLAHVCHCFYVCKFQELGSMKCNTHH
jgi:hypothetical protein